MSNLKIAVLSGTTREKRKSHNVAIYIAELGNAIEGVETILVDPKDFNFPGDGNDPEGKDPKYTKITKEADAFIIVTPEYNHSFPGSLKRMLDSEMANYIHKPVVVAGVSAGRWGGVRAVEHLMAVLREIGMIISFADLQFTGSYDLFDDNNKITDDSAAERIMASYTELIWLTKTLKWGRDNIESKYHDK